MGWRSLARWALGIYGVLLFLNAVRQAWSLPPGDFAATWPGGYAADLNPSLWEDTENRRWWSRPYWQYGPLYHALYLPLVFLPNASRVDRVMIVPILPALAASFSMLFQRSCRISMLPWALFLWGESFPVRAAMVQREVEAIVLLFLVLFVLAILGRRERASATWFVIAAWIKFFPIGILPWFWLKRRPRILKLALTTSFIVILVTQLTLDWRNSIVVSGRQDLEFGRLYWTSSAISSFGARIFADWTTLNEPNMATDLPVLGYGSGLALTFLLVAGAISWFWTHRAERDPIRELSVLLILMVLLPPFNHPHYLTVPMIPFTMLLPQLRSRGHRMAFWSSWTLINYGIPFSAMDAGLGILGWPQAEPTHILGHLSLATLGMLLLLGLLVTTSRAPLLEDRSPRALAEHECAFDERPSA